MEDQFIYLYIVEADCSLLEAATMIETITNKKTNFNYVEQNRSGDHIWWIGDLQKFKLHYPNWSHKYNIQDIITEIINK